VFFLGKQGGYRAVFNSFSNFWRFPKASSNPSQTRLGLLKRAISFHTFEMQLYKLSTEKDYYKSIGAAGKGQKNRQRMHYY